MHEGYRNICINEVIYLLVSFTRLDFFSSLLLLRSGDWKKTLLYNNAIQSVSLENKYLSNIPGFFLGSG